MPNGIYPIRRYSRHRLASRLDQHAEELLERARAFQAAAGNPQSSGTAPAVLDRLDEALQALSAAWCEIAADAAPGIVERWSRDGDGDPPEAVDRSLSHEQEAHLMASLHDVAGAFASCARACRDGRSTVAPLVGATEEGHPTAA